MKLRRLHRIEEERLLEHGERWLGSLAPSLRRKRKMEETPVTPAFSGDLQIRPHSGRKLAPLFLGGLENWKLGIPQALRLTRISTLKVPFAF